MFLGFTNRAGGGWDGGGGGGGGGGGAIYTIFFQKLNRTTILIPFIKWINENHLNLLSFGKRERL